MTHVKPMEKHTTIAIPERAGITALHKRIEIMKAMLVEMIIPVESMVKVTTGAITRAGFHARVTAGQWNPRQSYI